MANRVKEVSAFNGTSWGAAVPLGANDANIDITSSTSQPDGSAVSGVTGDSATALDTAAVAVASGDTGASAWTKFNRFRKRVASNFANYIQGSIATSYNATGSDSAVYSTNVLNNYMANVIGYSGTTAPEAGSVADQLSSLNDKIPYGASAIVPEDITILESFNIQWTSSVTEVIGYVWGSIAIFGLNIKFLTSSTISGPYINSYFFDGYAALKVQNRLVKDATGLMLSSNVLQSCYYQHSNQVVHFRKWSLSNTDSGGFYIKILSYLD